MTTTIYVALRGALVRAPFVIVRDYLLEVRIPGFPLKDILYDTSVRLATGGAVGTAVARIVHSREVTTPHPGLRDFLLSAEAA